MPAKPHFIQLGKTLLGPTECTLYRPVCVCVCVYVLETKLCFSVFDLNKKTKNLGMSIFGNPCLHTQLLFLMAISNASYTEFDDFTADKALGGQANQSFYFPARLSDLPVVTSVASDGAESGGA